MPDDRLAHIFVLMLENRSFDHIFGASGLPGIDGLSGGESNRDPQGGRLPVTSDAPQALQPDPPHEYQNVARQLFGSAEGLAGGIDLDGFAVSYADAAPRSHLPVDPRAVLRCQAPGNVPVLTTLASAYAVCDRWFSSLPGPTWPNRFFVHAATSGGLYCSPSPARTIASELVAVGFNFENGTVYDRLDAAGIWWRVYHGDDLPQVLSLAGMTSRRLFTDHFEHYDQFTADVAKPGYPFAYTFIEPAYGTVATGSIDSDFSGGDSGHPVGSIAAAERLVAEVYTAIRASPLWPSSLLVITCDEHGGFYDHVVPPAATPPGDAPRYAGHNPPEDPALGGLRGGSPFAFDRYGVRVPAVVVSPYIEAGTVCSEILDHTSIIATVLRNHGLPPLTARDAAAEDLRPLLTLSEPRTDGADAPLTVPPPATADAAAVLQPPPAAPAVSSLSPTTASFLHLAAQTDLQLSDIPQQMDLVARMPALATPQHAPGYITSVAQKVAQHEALAEARQLGSIEAAPGA